MCQLSYTKVKSLREGSHESEILSIIRYKCTSKIAGQPSYVFYSCPVIFEVPLYFIGRISDSCGTGRVQCSSSCVWSQCKLWREFLMAPPPKNSIITLTLTLYDQIHKDLYIDCRKDMNLARFNIDCMHGRSTMEANASLLKWQV